MNRRLVSLGCCAALVSLGGSSRADDADPKQKAEALLAKGRELMSSGKLGEACVALEQSEALAKRGDTLLNLAECHRRQGRTASAWKEFGKAAELAEEARFPDAVKVARERQVAIEGKLSFLTIQVPPETARLAGLELTLNGYPVPHDAWGQALPVDPGTFTIAARAEGRTPFSAQSRVDPEGDKREVTVRLTPLPPAPPAAPRPAPPPALAEQAPPSNANAYVSLGIASAGLLAGVGFSIAAARSSDRSAVGYGAAAGVAFAAFALAGASGTAYLVKNHRRSAPPAAAARASLRPFVAPMMGPGERGAVGGFTF